MLPTNPYQRAGGRWYVNYATKYRKDGTCSLDDVEVQSFREEEEAKRFYRLKLKQKEEASGE